MRVPIRKPGKYTHLKPDPNLTIGKYNELKAKLERLKKVQPFLRSEVKRLAADGDFSENVPYQMAKGKLRGVNKHVLEIEDHLKRAIIIEPQDNGTVQLGSTVAVEINGKEKQYKILGSSETNPLKNIISHNSPLGKALMGKKAGETVKIKTKEKLVEYKIVMTV